MKAHVTDYLLYKWRYHIGYACLALLVIGVLALAGLYVPGGLRYGEMHSALESGALSTHSIDPKTIVDLPYHILQRVSFLVFGVTTLSIKLPSILLGIATMFGVFLLVKSWFRRNIAIAVTAIATTTTQFLFLAQDGTPSIMFSFVAIWLLVSCTYMTRAHMFSTFWKVAACALTATALYIPLGIYLVIALIITASLHPHIRYMLRRIAKARLAIAIVLGMVALIPLVESIILDRSVALMLLGLPSSPINLQANIVTVGQDLFGFFLSSDSFLLRPLYSLGAIILMAVGSYKFLTVKYTARSYTIFVLAFCLIPLIIINPSHITDIYPLAILVIAMGIMTLVTSWYRLFPRNPYARVVGIIPIFIFVVGMVFTGVARYTNNYAYNANVLNSYTNDLRLLHRTVQADGSDKPSIVLVTTKSQQPFYALVAHYDHRFSVSTDVTKATTVIMTHDKYHSSVPPQMAISDIITSRKATDADRFYVYKYLQ